MGDLAEYDEAAFTLMRPTFEEIDTLAGAVERLQAGTQPIIDRVAKLTEALTLMRDWCFEGDEPDAPDGSGDLLAYVNGLLTPTGEERDR